MTQCTDTPGSHASASTSVVLEILGNRTAATRNPFDAKYSKVEDADWETCSLVLEPQAVKEQLSRGW